MIRLVGVFLFALAAFGQDYYIAYRATSSATSEKVTVQQPTSATKRVSFIAASVYCSVECTVALERGGTAASTTSLTANKVNSDSPSATAAAFHTSNVGSGTTLTTYTVAAGGTLTLDITRMRLDLTSQNNFTVVVTSGSTGSYKTTVLWQEE